MRSTFRSEGRRSAVGLIRTFATAVCVSATVAIAEPSVVRLVKTDRGWQLARNGRPYLVKGAGGGHSFAELAALGGNSTRTWGTDDARECLDKAQAAGITVTVGYWMGHTAHGFRYDDAGAVAAQLEKAREAVVSLKDHPALLMWAVGNEMEGHPGDDPAVWRAVNDVARMCKEEDPNHPTMTVIAEVGPDAVKIKCIHEYCSDVDIVGINTYGGVLSIGDRYRKGGGTKPYIITEFGPPGQWECGKTKWGAPLEMNSTDKAEWYLRGYRRGVEAHPDLCLGSYAFVWGHKIEATPTWYGLFLADGSRLAPVSSLARAWEGNVPENRCPITSNVTVSKDGELEPAEVIEASVKVSDLDGDKLEIEWVLYVEASTYAVGGHGLQELPTFPDAVVESKGQTARIRMPKGGGNYRLYAFARDGHGNASQANIPLRVAGEVLPLPIPKGKLPFVVYGKDQKGQPYAPSGYMGNTGAINMDASCSTKPFSDKTCLKVEYRANDNWGGVVWQSPPNDWGEKPGGFDLTGATTLEFRARGEKGGERVTFGMGILAGGDSKHPDTAKFELKDIVLATEWRKYRIPLDWRDLSRIKSGFYWTVAGQGRSITFYLDDIRYVRENTD